MAVKFKYSTKRNLKWAATIVGGLLVIGFCVFGIVSCHGNKQWFDTGKTNTFTHMYLETNDTCYEITSWKDYGSQDQIQVTLTDGTVLLVHSADCILVNKNGTCPICGHKD